MITGSNVLVMYESIAHLFSMNHIQKLLLYHVLEKKKDLIKINILRETLDSYNSKITQNINNPLLHL